MQLIEKYNSPAIGTLMNNSVVGSQEITNHAETFLLPGFDPLGNKINYQHNTGAGWIDLSRRTVPWRVILGRKFLQMCDFTYRGLDSKCKLIFGRNPLAR